MKPLETAAPTDARADAESRDLRRPGIRVLVVDDHPAVRAGVEALLGAQPEVGSVRAVSNARDAVSAGRAETCDVAVVDYHLPDRNGLSLTRQLNTLPHPPRVLIYSAFADTRLVIAALVAGAHGVCSKECADRELWVALAAVASGDASPPAVAPDAMRAIAGRVDSADLSILAMLVNRVEPAEIGAALGISRGWLEARRWAILQQLGERSRSAAHGRVRR